MLIGEDKDISELQSEARYLTRKKWGEKIDFYLPGMITLNGERGKYPAISITGESCELNCDHCGGQLLKSMIPATTPEKLIERCIKVNESGNTGCLISGGCLKNGRLPWEPFLEAISEVKRLTHLNISIHSGLIDLEIAKRFKDAGIDQCLIDVIGDDETFKTVFHTNEGIESVKNSLKALKQAGVPMAPHIVAGLNYGVIKGEFNALRMISEFEPPILVIVVLMPLAGTPMQAVTPLNSYEIARLMATARIEMPNTIISLGCARPRGKVGEELEILAMDSGVNRIAIWSDAAIKRAKEWGLQVNFHKTCCSV
ncbi:Radical SAM domain-containing protein [uncultured Desulfobacterium sp.]|uniref:Radical SAM domain-containing protein n=1 Tax=uncultured Desulfobacterium sp. TaxID=201089 RepID=A0A445MZD7_9BACT|nr:Radical SAM domain-containing protein [uncultured Desulfobacterium sp.]